MRLGERLLRLEGRATAAETVVAWAEAAAAWGSVDRYRLAMLDDANATERFGTVLAHACVSRWAASRRLPADVRWLRHRAHHRDLVLLHELVLLIEDVVATTAVDVDREAGQLTGGIDRLCSDGARIDRGLARRWVDDAGATVRRGQMIHRSVRELEARHLLGHDAAFPHTRAAWTRLDAHLADLRSMAEVLLGRHLPGVVAPCWEPAEDAVERWTDYLWRAACIRAHLELGERERALERIARWGMTLTPGPVPPQSPDQPGPPGREPDEPPDAPMSEDDLRSSST